MVDSISRRSFLAAAVGAACGGALPGCSASKNAANHPKQLNIYSWADYVHPDTIPQFEKRYGIDVVYDTFSSNEALLAKLQAGASNYDIVVPTSYMVKELIKLGIVLKLDHERLPLLKNIMPRFADQAFDPKLEHSVPYTWGTTGIAYNTMISGSERDQPRDWDAFWDKRFAHRITLLDDCRETIGMALKRRGQSYNCTDHEQIKLAINDLQAQKPLTMCYTSDQVIIQLCAEDSWLSLAFSGDACQAARENKAVKYVLPESGASIWMDNLCIPKSAPHVENAYRWINFMLEPNVAEAVASFTRFATPNWPAFKMLDKAFVDDKNLYPPESVLDKCESIADLGQQIFFYDRMWTELKCS